MGASPSILANDLLSYDPDFFLGASLVAVPFADRALEFLQFVREPAIFESKGVIDKQQDNVICFGSAGVFRPPPTTEYRRPQRGMRVAVDADILDALGIEVIDDPEKCLFLFLIVDRQMVENPSANFMKPLPRCHDEGFP